MYTIYPYASRYNTVHNSETAKLLTEQLQQDPDIKDEIKWIIPSKRIVLNYFLATHMHVYQCSASVLNIHHDDITIIFMALHLLYRRSAPLL